VAYRRTALVGLTISPPACDAEAEVVFAGVQRFERQHGKRARLCRRRRQIPRGRSEHRDRSHDGGQRQQSKRRASRGLRSRCRRDLWM
jgi:hypothetical protein